MEGSTEGFRVVMVGDEDGSVGDDVSVIQQAGRLRISLLARLEHAPFSAVVSQLHAVVDKQRV